MASSYPEVGRLRPCRNERSNKQLVDQHNDMAVAVRMIEVMARVYLVYKGDVENITVPLGAETGRRLSYTTRLSSFTQVEVPMVIDKLCAD